MPTKARIHGLHLSKRQSLRLEQLEPRCLLAADPLITEFMASNNGAVLDGYGASPDWIEIFNNGDQSVDLEDYVLTDNDEFDDDGDGWQFPSVVLDPGEYLIVFASGSNTVDPAGNLHTDFGLGSSGDYLALASPQGVILSEFGSDGEDYPPLAPNESYGLGFESTFTEVVNPSSAVKYLVPTDGSVDSVWMVPGFNDAAWQSGVASLGYEETPDAYDSLIGTVLPNPTESVYVRIPFSVTDPDAVIGTLQMKYDDGFVAYLNGTQIASVNAPASPVFDSDATAVHIREATIEDAIFNVSGYSDSLQVGTNVLAIHVLDAPDSRSFDLLLSTSLTIGSGDLISPLRVAELITPTPGLPNTNTVAGEVQFSRSGGVFKAPFDLTLTSTVPGETIRYTLDGSVPSSGSPAYSVPLNIDATTRVRARAYGADGRVGRDFSAAFTLADLSEQNFESTLPIVVLENFGDGRPGRDFEDAYLSLYEPDPSSGVSDFQNEPTLTTAIGQHRRGASTFNSAKFSLRVELRDDAGQDRDESLLGMPADSDWILYAAGVFDRSLVRNSVIYDLSNQSDNYAVRTRYVEVYNNIDGGSIDSLDYYGIYVLMENIKATEDRVDVETLEPTIDDPAAIESGYIFKQDISAVAEENSRWTTDRSQPIGQPAFEHVSPNRSDLQAEQVDYIRGSIQEFEDALYGANWRNPDTGYNAYIDSATWIEHHLLRVFFNDNDTLFKSEYFSKDRDGKIEAGPVWDFNLSSGYNGSAVPTSWKASDFNSGWWWGRLFNDSNFTQQWVDSWQSLRSGTLSDANLVTTVDAHSDTIRASTAKNFERWTQLPAVGNGVYADPNESGWEGEISHFAGWLVERAAWVDSQITPTAEFSIDPGFVLPGQELTIEVSDPGAAIYYTTDGSDPRAAGGGVSPSALLYENSILIDQTVVVKARVYNASRSGQDLGPWSAITEARYTTEVAADATSLRISEIHYNPLDPSNAELTVVPDADNNSFEFIELINVSEQPIDLNGVEFTEGIDFDFSVGSINTLAPGQTVLIVQNNAAFEARYGTGLPVTGEYDGRLSGGGEDIILLDAVGEVIQSFEYDDESPWPEAADGDGPSIEVIDLLGDATLGTNWRASAIDNGTPGTATAPLLGDYDRSGVVDDLDRVVWVSQYGATVAAPGVGADGNRDGRVNAADYGFWRDQVGATAVATAILETTAPSASAASPLVTPAIAELQEKVPRSVDVAHEAFADYSVPTRSTESATMHRGRSTSLRASVTDRALLLVDSQPLAAREIEVRLSFNAGAEEFDADRNSALAEALIKEGRDQGLGRRVGRAHWRSV